MGNVEFWLGVFEIEVLDEHPPLGPITAAGTRFIAIEVVHQRTDSGGDGGWAILFSAIPDNGEEPATLIERIESGNEQQALRCVIGFTNAPRASRAWNDRGFPLIDAPIDAEIEDGSTRLLVKVDVFNDADDVMSYGTRLIVLSGLPFSSALDAVAEINPDDAVGTYPGGPVFAMYYQELQAPDSVQPHLMTARRPITWLPKRSSVRRRDAAAVRLRIGPPPARSPRFAPLPAMRPLAAWTGQIARRPRRDQARQRLKPVPLSDTFGAPAFRFEDVEVLGFRIDLGDLDVDADDLLTRLVRPLNFHLKSRAPGSVRGFVPDFQYRAATRTIVVELLRYGAMSSRSPVPPLTPDDRQSQHELLVRLLVGRVDDDTAQAHEPAVYVPAIFVDNPWSTLLGRNQIGFDKHLASFHTGRKDGLLLPDGRPAAGGDPLPLGDVSEIRLVNIAGREPGAELLQLEYGSRRHIDPAALRPVNMGLTFGRSFLADTRWRQADFDAAEFRRGFATEAMAENLRCLRCVQVAPTAQRQLDPAWITGELTLDPGVRVDIPPGLTTLRFWQIPRPFSRASVKSTTGAWNALCAALGATPEHPATVTLTSGSWYRLHCSMDLRLDDALAPRPD
jgi:hypothetical protein